MRYWNGITLSVFPALTHVSFTIAFSLDQLEDDSLQATQIALAIQHTVASLPETIVKLTLSFCIFRSRFLLSIHDTLMAVDWFKIGQTLGRLQHMEKLEIYLQGQHVKNVWNDVLQYGTKVSIQYSLKEGGLPGTSSGNAASCLCIADLPLEATTDFSYDVWDIQQRSDGPAYRHLVHVD